LQNKLYYCALNPTNVPLIHEKILIRNPHATTNANASSGGANEASSPQQPSSSNNNNKIPVTCFNIDDELIYWNFFLDYGPLNLGQLYRFSLKLNRLLDNNNTNNTPFTDSAILFYSSTTTNKRANAIFLICAWQILHLKRTPEEAYYGFKLNHNQVNRYQYNHSHEEENDDDDEHSMMMISNSNHSNHSNHSRSDTNTNTNTNASNSRSSGSSSNPPIYPLSTIGKETIASLPAFHDASPYQCPYELTLLDCLTSLQKAYQYNFFDWGLTLNNNTNSNSNSNSGGNNSSSSGNNINTNNKFDIDEYEYFEQVEVSFILSLY
jgi:hypothetical protein